MILWPHSSWVVPVTKCVSNFKDKMDLKISYSSFIYSVGLVFRWPRPRKYKPLQILLNLYRMSEQINN